MQDLVFALAASSEEPGILFTCLLGVGVVFIGLVAIVGIVMLMNFFFSRPQKEKAPREETPVVQSAPKASAAIPNRQEVLAAVVAAVAEENGTDISAIRVLSFKKIN